MKRVLALLFLTTLTASAQEFRARVSEVHNGNTISIQEVGRRGTELVHLEGIVVPGRWRPFAAKSRESLRELVKYKVVTIIPRGHSRFGRITATVLLDNLDVGLEQIRRGLAWYEQEGSHIPAYEAAEAEAERQGVGLWAPRR